MKSVLDSMRLEYTRYQALEKRIEKEWNGNKYLLHSQKLRPLYHVILILTALELGTEKFIYSVDSI